MNDKLKYLKPDFQEKCHSLLFLLKDRYNIIMVPIEGLRPLETQAKYWRRGRSTIEINKEIQKLRSQGADYLSDVLEKVGPQSDPHIVTYALPGYSWHNWGLALDCHVAYEGDEKHLIADPKDPLYKSYAEPKYKTYADEAVKMGLNAGYYFAFKTTKGPKKFVDAAHIQYYNKEIPNLFTLLQVNNQFKPKSI